MLTAPVPGGHGVERNVALSAAADVWGHPDPLSSGFAADVVAALGEDTEPETEAAAAEARRVVRAAVDLLRKGGGDVGEQRRRRARDALGRRGHPWGVASAAVEVAEGGGGLSPAFQP